MKVDPEQPAKVPAGKPVKKKKAKPPRKTGKGWLGVFIVFFIILVLLFIEYKDSFFTSSPPETVTRTVQKPPAETENEVKPTVNLDDSETENA